MELRSRWLQLVVLLVAQQAQSTPFQRQLNQLFFPTTLERAAVAAEAAAQTTQNPLTALRKQDCASTCGAQNQLCCASGETCITHADGSASCSGWPHKILAARQQSGTWQTYTSIWVETSLITSLVTKTSVYSAFVPASTGSLHCNTAAQETDCTSLCCPSGYWCVKAGTCAVAGSGGMTTVGVVGTVPARPTTISGVVTTSTVRASTMQPYQTPVTTGASNGTGTIQASSSSGGLSGGAIAGIVIGVLLGIALLFLLCFCCCLQGLLSCLGCGKKRKRDRREHTTVISEDEYISRRRRGGGGGLGAALGFGAASGAAGRQWAGRNSRRSESDRYTRTSRRPPPRNSGWGTGLTALASGAGAATLLGLFSGGNKKRDRRRGGRSEKSSSTESYSYYSYDESSSADSRSRRASRRGGSRTRYEDRRSRTVRSRSRRR